MLDPDNQTLKDIILNAGVCSPEQMKDAEEEHERTGKPLKEILIDFQILSEDQILEVIANSLGTDVVNLNESDPERQVIEMVDGDTARMLGVCPISFDGTTLTVAARNPLNYQVSDELRFLLGKDIMVVVASDSQIDRFIEKFYPVDMESVHDMLAEMDVGDDAASLDAADVESAANEAPIVKFVNAVMYQAIKDKASDIHFEPFEKEFKIRCRVDGALYELAPPPKSLAVPVISRVKILSGLNISERRKPQDGRIQLKIAASPSTSVYRVFPPTTGNRWCSVCLTGRWSTWTWMRWESTKTCFPVSAKSSICRTAFSSSRARPVRERPPRYTPR